MPTLTLTPEEARDIVCQSSKDWRRASDEEMVDQRRWVTVFTAVFKHLPTGKHYDFNWEQGSTEMQEQDPYEDDTEVIVYEVKLIEKIVEVWEIIKDN